MVKSKTMPGLTYMLTRIDHGWNCDCPDNVDFCKHVWTLEYKSGDKGRAGHELALYRAGQVQKVGEGRYKVKSRLSEFIYEVEKFSFGWPVRAPTIWRL